MSKKIIKFASAAAREAFVKDLPAEEFTKVSDKEIEIVLADVSAANDNGLRELYANMDRMFSYAMQRVYACEDMLHKHAYAGHIPPITSAEQMKRAIAKLGLDDEYQVQSKVIYASTTAKDKSGNLLVNLVTK